MRWRARASPARNRSPPSALHRRSSSSCVKSQERPSRRSTSCVLQRYAPWAMPGRAPVGVLAPWHFDREACRADLTTFADLLAAKPALSERDDILPFFRDHGDLAALLGSFNPSVAAYDRLGGLKCFTSATS